MLQLQKLHQALSYRQQTAYIIVEKALQMERPPYYDSFITSELLELLEKASSLVFALHKDRRRVCRSLRHGCDELMHQYRHDWGWEAFQVFATIAFNMAYDGAKVKDGNCFHLGVHLLTSVCHAANAHLSPQDAADIRSDHWQVLAREVQQGSKTLLFFRAMEQWSLEKYSKLRMHDLQDCMFNILGVSWV